MDQKRPLQTIVNEGVVLPMDPKSAKDKKGAKELHTVGFMDSKVREKRNPTGCYELDFRGWCYCK